MKSIYSVFPMSLSIMSLCFAKVALCGSEKWWPGSVKDKQACSCLGVKTSLALQRVCLSLAPVLLEAAYPKAILCILG